MQNTLSIQEELDVIEHPAKIELASCDDDIKEYFGGTEFKEEWVYEKGLPSKIQLNRLLRELISVLKESNKNTCNCGNSNHNI